MRSDDPLWTDSFGTQIYMTVTQCSVPDENPGAWYPGIIFVLAVMMALLFMASLNRKVPSAFAESKWVAWR